jgi:hypothetical protein
LLVSQVNYKRVFGGVFSAEAHRNSHQYSLGQ